MKKLITLAAFALLAVTCAWEQSGQSSGILYATDFNWNLPQGSTPTAGMIQWPTAAICTVSSNGFSFVAVKVGRPLTIVDVVPTQTETVIPTAVTTTGGSCTVTAPMTYTHTSYSVRSGTAGLQEAIDYSAHIVGGSVVWLTPSWTVAGGQTSMIAAAYGQSITSILDGRVASLCSYGWNGSSYAATGCGTNSASLTQVLLQTFAGPLSVPQGMQNTPIGATTPSTGAFTSLTSTSGALNGTVGATTPNTGAFTSLTSTGGAFNGSIGSTTPNTGAFTSATLSGLFTGTSAQFNGSITPVSGGSITENGIVSPAGAGGLTIQPSNLAGILVAAQFSGTGSHDCGDKINQAFASTANSVQVWVDQSCAAAGALGSTAIVVPSGDTLKFIGGGVAGVYTTSGGVTLNANSVLISDIPCAPDACPVTIRASGGLTNVITVSGPSAVLKDVTVDGNASTLIGSCSAGGGTVGGGALVNVSSGAGRFRMENVELKCGAGDGILISGAQNVDVSHSQIIANLGRGYACVNTADEFISDDTQIDGNGMAGLELNGCSALRATNIDVSSNGSAGAALSTGCEIYVHGSSGHLAGNNMIGNLNSGARNSMYCEIGTGQFTKNNQISGFTSLGSAAAQPVIYLHDVQNDLFEGTVDLGSQTAAVAISETSPHSNTPSTFRIANFGPTWTDSSAYPSDFTGSVQSLTYYLGPYITCTSNGAQTCAYTDPISTFNDLGMVTFYEPNQTAAGGYTSSIRVGRSGSTNNSAELGFTSAGTGSASNTANLGLSGGVVTTVDGNGNTAIAGGTNIVYRCATSGSLPVGALTINSGNCGTTADTGLRVK